MRKNFLTAREFEETMRGKLPKGWDEGIPDFLPIPKGWRRGPHPAKFSTP